MLKLPSWINRINSLRKPHERIIEHYDVFKQDKAHSYVFDTYAPEYGTDIVRLPDGSLISPRRPEEVKRPNDFFTSKAKGQFIIKKLIRGTNATMLPFIYLKSQITKKMSDVNLFKLLHVHGSRILVRSDNVNSNSFISQWDRLLQPRASFPNTAQGRAEALRLIKDLNGHYSVIIHHTTRPSEDILGHGRVCVNGNTGNFWIYFAKKDPSTNTFSRWEHDLILTKSGDTEKLSDTAKKHLTDESISTCKQFANKIYKMSKQEHFDDVTTMNLVFYKGKKRVQDIEVYDLLYVEGMKEPALDAF